MARKYKPHEDKRWLASIRSDLDSDPTDWVVPPGEPDDYRGISKASAVESHLDRLLTSLGHPKGEQQ